MRLPRSARTLAPGPHCQRYSTRVRATAASGGGVTAPHSHACCGSAPFGRRLACLKLAVGAERGYWACWSPPNGTSAQRRDQRYRGTQPRAVLLANLTISTEAAQKLARALGVSMDYLIGTFADDELGDGKPASMALVSVSYHDCSHVLRGEHARESSTAALAGALDPSLP